MIKQSKHNICLCPTSRWAGGTTTQLMIWPLDASYPERDFLFRVSSADVQCQRSDFTPLPGVTRFIAPLDGTLRLCFEEHGEQTLAPYQVACFDGGWTTVSHGKARDFNLMLNGCRGGLQSFLLPAEDRLSFSLAPAGEKGGFELFYFPQSGCALEFEGKTQACENGDLAIFEIRAGSLPQVMHLCAGGAPAPVLHASVVL